MAPVRQAATLTRARAAENFPVALRVLPAATRGHLIALYDFARTVDDIGDEDVAGSTPAERLAALDLVEAGVRAVYRGRPAGDPVLDRLAGTVVARGLPIDPLLRLIEANRMDQTVTRYETFEQLREYCRLSADPVGELVLYVFEVATPERIALSDRICTALQIIEHLQDIGEDARRGHVYLPGTDLDRYGVPLADLTAVRASAALRDLVAYQASRAAAFLESGAALVPTLRGWARLAVSGYVAGGRAALVALSRAGYDPLGATPRGRRRDVLGQWLRATVRSAG